MRAIRYGNWHSVVEIYDNVTFVMKLLIIKKTFEKILVCSLGDNCKSTNTDLFQKKK